MVTSEVATGLRTNGAEKLDWKFTS
jgi:hypothetical protein